MRDWDNYLGDDGEDDARYRPVVIPEECKCPLDDRKREEVCPYTFYPVLETLSKGIYGVFVKAV